MKKRPRSTRSAIRSHEITDMPEIPTFIRGYDEDLDLHTASHIKEHARNVTSKLSPTSKRQLSTRRNIALLQGIDHRLSNPIGYFNQYQDTMRSIELTKNKLTEPTESVVVAITAMCLCHGGIIGNITIHINPFNIDSMASASKTIRKEPVKNASREVIKNICTVNYSRKFEFVYETIPYCGLFTNVGSCPGLPTFEPPNSFFNVQSIVTHEYNLLTCNETTAPEKCQPYMLSISLDPVISRKLKETTDGDVSDKDLSLTMHDDYLCQSLVNKIYQVKLSEIVTEDFSITSGDNGKFILLTKIKHMRDGIEEFEIIKTIILGTNNFHEELELLGRKTNKDMSEFTGLVKDNTLDIDGSIDTFYTTTTEEIVGLINHLKDGDTPVRFFDSSCNMFSDIDYKNPTPLDLLELDKINKHFVKEAKKGHAVHGGTKQTRRFNRLRR